MDRLPVATRLSEDMRRRLAELPPERRLLVERRLGLGTASETNGARPHREGASRAPTSFNQELLWRLDRSVPGLTAYNVPRVLRVAGPIEEDTLRAALNDVVARHEALRTRFVESEAGPVQVVEPRGEVPLRFVDLSTLPEEEREREATRLVTERTREPIDLERDLLLRALLLKMGEADHVLHLLTHHIVADEWSRDVLVRELDAFYTARRKGCAPDLPNLPIQYSDYASWQRREMDGGVLADQLAFWKDRLQGLEVLKLPTDRLRGSSPTFSGERRRRVIQGVAEDLNRLAKAHNVTLNMVLLAAFNVLLHRYSGQTDIAVGTAASTRRHVEVEGLIGLFTNTLVLRTDLSGDPTFCALLERVRDTCVEALENQEVPFERLALERREGDRRTAPLVSVSYMFETPRSEAFKLDGAPVSMVLTDAGSAKFDLTLGVGEVDGGVRATVEYRTDLFERVTIDRMLGHLEVLLRFVATAPDTRISAVPLLSDEERGDLAAWNATTLAYDDGVSLVELVRERSGVDPEAQALEFEGETWSYAEVERRANQLGNHLRRIGVGRGSLVALYLERSRDMVVVVLAVHRAGAAYLPIDPSCPRERIGFMLTDSGAGVIVTEEQLRAGLPAHGARLVSVDGDAAAIAAAPDTPLIPEDGPERLAYVIYTSGSTGKPKGVQVEHRNVVNFLAGLRRHLPMEPGDTLVAVTPLSFDISVLEMFLPLTSGAKIVVASRHVAANPGALADLLARTGATHFQATPSTWQMLVDSGWRGQSGLTGLCGGEALPQPLADALIERGVDLWNLYGPTEATIWATLKHQQHTGEPVSIGRPMANVTAHVLDGSLRPQPVGIQGELFLGGRGLARGYLNRPELSSQRFVIHPESGERLYRTGDLVRRLPDGTLDFLGRTDSQVKLRGHRIELGEVEAALVALAGVSSAAAIVREDVPGDPRLVGYVTAAGGDAIGPVELRRALQETLPPHMLPSAIVVLSALPVNANGKVDRRALPPPDGSADTGTPYAAPRTPLEAELAAAWAEVLQVDRLGIDDDFYALGGHSLLAMRLVGLLSARLPATLTIGAVLEMRTVRRLAEWVTRQMGGVAEEVAGEDISALLAELEAMPEEEAVRRLQGGSASRGSQ